MPKEFVAEIEWRKPEDLTPYPFNNKLHDSQQIDKVAGSIAEFGCDQPLVIDSDGVIIKGHARREAALRLGLDKVPVVVRNDLSEAQKKASRIADNRTAVSDFDEQAIALELEALKELEYDLSQTGFDSEEIDELLKLNGGEGSGDGSPEDEDDVPDVEEVQPREGLVLGSIWQLGRHRLFVGDCTDPEIQKLLKQECNFSETLLLIDPPYGIDLNSEWQNQVHRKEGKALNRNPSSILNDRGEIQAEMFEDWSNRVVFGFPYLYDPLATGWLVWDKEPGFQGRSLTSPVEMAYSTTWQGFRAIRLLWSGYMREAGSEDKVGHPTQKPVRLIREIIEYHSYKKVIDLFLGSGTTLIAAEESDRTVYGCELSPIYCEIILQRFFTLYQIEPELIYSPGF